ncbi:MAG: hypothetical protein R2723_11405 [Microbacterium sp.]
MIDVFAGFEFPTRTAPDTSSRRIPRIVKDSSHDGVAFVDLVDLGDHRVDLFLGYPFFILIAISVTPSSATARVMPLR